MFHPATGSPAPSLFCIPLTTESKTIVLTSMAFPAASGSEIPVATRDVEDAKVLIIMNFLLHTKEF